MKGIRLGSVLLAAALLATAPASAFAHDEGTRDEGICSQGSEFRLDVDLQNEGLRTRFEVVQGVDGDRWRVLVTDNGMVLFRGHRVTDDGGAFRVEIVSEDLEGIDNITALARNLRTTETCRAAVSF
jgi:hypothetical protein